MQKTTNLCGDGLYNNYQGLQIFVNVARKQGHPNFFKSIQVSGTIDKQLMNRLLKLYFRTFKGTHVRAHMCMCFFKLLWQHERNVKNSFTPTVVEHVCDWIKGIFIHTEMR